VKALTPAEIGKETGGRIIKVYCLKKLKLVRGPYEANRLLNVFFSALKGSSDAPHRKPLR